MAMGKKDFIQLADMLRPLLIPHTPASRADCCYYYTEEMEAIIVAFCKSQNPNFNKERWLGYLRGECGPNGGTIKKEN